MEGVAESSIRLVVRVVGTRDGMLERPAHDRSARRRGQIPERAGADGREKRCSERRALLAIHRADGQTVHVCLQATDDRAPRAATSEEHMVGREAELLKNRE